MTRKSAPVKGLTRAGRGCLLIETNFSAAKEFACMQRSQYLAPVRPALRGFVLAGSLLAAAAARAEHEGVHVRGTISQQEVSAGFRALLPLYLEFDQGQFVRFALAPMIGATTVPIERLLKTPKKPRRLLVNLRSGVLARD
jgi:hypothetical protein